VIKIDVLAANNILTAEEVQQCRNETIGCNYYLYKKTIMSLLHLSLPIKDFEETRFFYCDLLKGIQEKTTLNWFNVNLKKHNVPFNLFPDYQETGTPAERVKMVFTDPSNYLIEFKTYKHSAATF
jgi:extradiol dioxygenase family protein